MNAQVTVWQVAVWLVLGILLAQLLGCDPSPVCVRTDGYDGWVGCDPVDECVDGDGLYHRTLDGTVYDCPSDPDACTDLLCARCDLDAATRSAVCR